MSNLLIFAMSQAVLSITMAMPPLPLPPAQQVLGTNPLIFRPQYPNQYPSQYPNYNTQNTQYPYNNNQNNQYPNNYNQNGQYPNNYYSQNNRWARDDHLPQHEQVQAPNIKKT